jgi:glycosyltransferase involved in cell wall biosynthesis
LSRDRYEPSSFTVVVAVRNAVGTIERCIQSVLAQTQPDVQLVVMDGASTDGTRAILERYDTRIDHWESAPDRGVYHAWNKAIDHATGRWVTFLGADDRLANDSVMAEAATALGSLGPDVRVAYGSLLVVDEEDRVVRRIGEPWDRIKTSIGTALPLPQPATFHHRSLFDEHGRFDESYRICGDYEFLLREVLHRDPVFLPGTVIVEMRAGGMSDDPRWQALLHIENHRAQRRHGLAKNRGWRSPSLIRARTRLAIQRALGSDREEAAIRAYRRVLRRP